MSILQAVDAQFLMYQLAEINLRWCLEVDEVTNMHVTKTKTSALYPKE